MYNGAHGGCKSMQLVVDPILLDLIAFSPFSHRDTFLSESTPVSLFIFLVNCDYFQVAMAEGARPTRYANGMGKSAITYEKLVGPKWHR